MKIKNGSFWAKLILAVICTAGLAQTSNAQGAQCRANELDPLTHLPLAGPNLYGPIICDDPCTFTVSRPIPRTLKGNIHCWSDPVLGTLSNPLPLLKWGS